MYSYEIFIKETNETEYSPLRSWARPFTDGTTLDETLDEGRINLSLTTRSKAIAPFSKIRIKIYENVNGQKTEVGEINRVVGSTTCVKKKYAGRELYDWSIQTLEETKLLERYVCDSMMSTNYLSKEYAEGFGLIQPEGTDDAKNMYVYGEKALYYGPYIIGSTLYVYDTFDLFRFKGTSSGETGGEIYVKNPNDETILSISYMSHANIELNMKGTYKIIYHLSKGGPFGSSYRDITFNIGVFEQSIKTSNPTITSVCERLLSAGITRRKGIDTQKFTLDTAFAEKYKDVPAPEFSFTRQTLFEALLTVGGYIHAIPRLNGNIVTFDELGGDDEVDMTNFPKMVYEDKTQDINDFCSTIDSPAQNLINTQDRVGGAITELGNDYITVRAEDAEVIISADTAIIRTSMPINQIVKLECGFIEGRTEPVGDITAYVYEAAEYDVLSSYKGAAYPYSKAYALRYVQGDNKITGLQEVLKSSDLVDELLNTSSIINIINAVTRKTISTKEIARLAFRVTYVPIVTSRVTQRKPYGDSVNGASNGASWDNALVYNQGGNTMESTFYGDKMKGAIARLGNEVIQRTYDFVHYNQIPKCGQKMDGMYIARVDCEYDLVRIRATITLTKDFNMLSQYVGLNSNYRLYDISEKQSIERFINYSENIYVGDRVEYKGGAMLRNLITCIYGTLLTPDSNRERVQVAVISGQDKDGKEIGNPVILPVMTFGFGNSLVFMCSMYDNYGAGFQNSKEINEVILGSYVVAYKGVQRLVPYSNMLGEMETMSVKMGNKGWENPTYNDQAENGKAQLYPQYVHESTDSIFTGNAEIDTYYAPLIVKKDSREALSLVYQAHFISNRQTIVLGPSLTYSNALVTNPKKRNFVLYFFDHELNMLDKVIDLKNANKYTGSDRGYRVVVSNTNSYVMLSIANNTTNKTYKSWGIVEVQESNSSKGTLFLGENVTINPNCTPPDIYFTIRSNG